MAVPFSFKACTHTSTHTQRPPSLQHTHTHTHMGYSQEFLVFCACACVLIVLVIIRKLYTHRGQPLLLPSPPARPIIGHLHLLKQPVHRTLYNLAQKYGPFFCIKMGSSSALIISSTDWAKEVFLTHDRDFADRPRFEASKRLFYNHRSMIMMEHGPLWRHLRKLYTVNMLTAKRIEMFENARFDEMAMSIQLVKKQALEEGSGVNMRQLVFNTVGNMMTRMLFSKRSFDASESIDGRKSRFKDMMEEFSVLFGTPLLSDLIPWLGWLDIQGAKKKMDRLAKEVDTFLDAILVERIETKGDAKDEDASDYLDILISVYKEDGKLDKDSIKCILLDILIASTESITTTIEWTIAELMTSPKSMKKLQEELDTLVGGGALIGNKCVKDDDLAKLTYLQSVIKETLRLHPPFAVIMHQMCKSLDKGKIVKGYYLPKEIKVFYNIWAIGRDTNVWGSNAEVFFPDRFLSGSAPDLRGQHFEFLPFGTGRRGCPGMNLAMTVAPLVVANLVQVFNWKTPNDAPLDLSEAVAFTTPLSKPLVAIPTLRKSF